MIYRADNICFFCFRHLKIGMESVNGFENKLKEVMPQLTDMLQIHDFYYVINNGEMKAVLDPSFSGNAKDISNIMTDDVFSESILDTVKKQSPVFYDTLMNHGFESVMIVRIRKGSDIYGYLICAVKRSLRIWQEYECAILYFLSELLADEFVK